MSSPSELASMDLAAAATLLAATAIGMLMLCILGACVIWPWLGEWFAAGRRQAPPQPARINLPGPPPQRSTPSPSPWARPPTVRPMTYPRNAPSSAARPDDATFVGAPTAASGRGERLPSADISALSSQRPRRRRGSLSCAAYSMTIWPPTY